jgi:hypothetical protein
VRLEAAGDDRNKAGRACADGFVTGAGENQGFARDRSAEKWGASPPMALKLPAPHPARGLIRHRSDILHAENRAVAKFLLDSLAESGRMGD